MRFMIFMYTFYRIIEMHFTVISGASWCHEVHECILKPFHFIISSGSSLYPDGHNFEMNSAHNCGLLLG